MWIRVWSVCVFGVMTWGNVAGAGAASFATDEAAMQVVTSEVIAMQGRLVTGLESGFAIGRVAPDWDFVPKALALLEASADRAGREGVGRPHSSLCLHCALPGPVTSAISLEQDAHVSNHPASQAAQRTMEAAEAGQAEKSETSGKAGKAEKADRAGKASDEVAGGKGQAGSGAGKKAGGGGSAKGGDTPINLNSSTLEQIEALPGIGPSLAARIVEYREQHGPFKRIEDLMNVRGVGEKNFLKLKPLIIVTPAKAER